MSVEDPGQASGAFQVLHGIWTTILTGFGLLLMWNGRRLVNQVDGKAEKKDLDDHKESVDKRFEAMQNELHRMIDAQGKQHEQNSGRLDTILLELSRGSGRMS